jgi:phenylalanine-4-hydroxylase
MTTATLPPPATTSGPDFQLDGRLVYWPALGWFILTRKQASIVQSLWAARQSRLVGLHQYQLLADADSDSERLIDVFKHSPAWKRLVVPCPIPGYYTLPALENNQ